MGYMRHHAIIVTDWDSDRIKQLHAAVSDGQLPVTPIVMSLVNGYESFVVLPDGSKEGWADSYAGDECREKIISLLRQSSVSWAEVQYGDENGVAEVLRHRDDQID